jgi:hypothetical protein
MKSAGGKPTARYAENLARYEALVATNAQVTRKGATMPYTSVNGHMFSLLTKDGSVILRLSDDDREAFVARFKTPVVVQYGAVLKEYVELPDPLLARTKDARKFFDQSFRYVSALKPKPTRKATGAKKSSQTS